jgi:hypothetical protein
MSTAQDPARRLKQKRRRQTQLAAWRAKQDASPPVEAAPSKSAKPAPKA